MKRAAATAAAVIITGLVGLSPRGAEASQCGYPSLKVFPANGTEVPRNVVFFVEMQFAGVALRQAKLSGPPGDVWVRRSDVTSQVVAFTPTEPLVPGATYSFEVVDDVQASTIVNSVTVAAADDTTLPSTPTIISWTLSSFEHSTGRGVYKTEWYDFDIEGRSDDAPGAVMGVRFFAGPSVDEIDYSTPAAMNFDEVPRISDSLCYWNLPLFKTPDLAVALQTVDSAGNVSEIGPAKQIRSAGCSSVTAPPIVLLLTALLRPKRNGPRGR